MRILDFHKGIIEGDEKVIERAQGVDINTVDVSEYRPDADNLAKLFDVANRRLDKESASLYVALKQKIIDNFKE